MRSIEVEGEDIDQAIANALRALQVERERVEIEILNAATRGVLGFGARKARIRATVRAPIGSIVGGAEWASPPDVPQGTGFVEPGVETTGEEPRPAESATPRDVTERASRFLEGLLQAMGTTCTVEAQDEPDGGVALTVVGPETAIVIGRRGQTLDAIEYVVNRAVARDDTPSGTPRVVVDAEGYRARRREYLEELAARLCDKVARTGRTVSLNPMTPRDRRIVHLVVQQRGLTSRSYGEGHVRAMQILPRAGRERRSPGGTRRPVD